MLPDFEYKWKLNLWEHDPGRSRVARELSDFAGHHKKEMADLADKLSFFQKKDFLELERTQDMKTLKGGGGLGEIRIRNPNVRFLGYMDKFVTPPVFHTLLFYYKKSNKIPQNVLTTAQERFREFKLNQK